MMNMRVGLGMYILLGMLGVQVAWGQSFPSGPGQGAGVGRVGGKRTELSQRGPTTRRSVGLSPRSRRLHPSAETRGEKSKPQCRRGEATLLFRGMVGDVMVHGGNLAVLEPSHRVLGVRDMKTGKWRWRKTFQKQPIGVHSLHTTGSQVIVYGGARLFSFAMVTGQRLGRRDVRLHWHLRHQNGCTFVYRHGVCALSCGDEFQLLHCETMYPMSRAYALTRTCFSGNCFSFRGRVVGEFSSLWLAEVEEPKRSSTEGEGRRKRMVVAVHRKTGAEIWESNEIAVLLWHSEESGFSPDRTICWLANYTGETKVFDCQKGTLLWSMPVLLKKNYGSLMHRHVRWHRDPAGVIVLERNHISLRDVKTGNVLWQRHLPPRTVAGLEKGVWPHTIHRVEHPMQHWTLSAHNGAILRTLTIASGSRFWTMSDGVIVVVHGNVVSWYRRGIKKQVTVPFAVTDVVATESGWIVVGKEQLRWVGKRDGSTLLHLAGSWEVFATEDLSGRGRIVLRRKQPNNLWEVRLFSRCIP